MGQWEDDKRHGQGTYTCADGTKYDGEWKYGKFLFTDVTIADDNRNPMDGKHTIKLPWGDTYEGELQNGKVHGQGTYIFKNGAKYVGQWIEWQTAWTRHYDL